ncbi:anti-sigma factor domain-containing protein [Demequina iriomotensis]|uniref:anti-sigma factor domain-containing protein n=1 Tax=Demequina iriomotensis TaxID=1536641 RepID=UPI00078444BB|nr:anti-sigma factor [Demequina iriomotensis]
MCEPEVEDAYRESGALVHTLALRSLGSVDEAEDVVRRVFASAAAGGSLASRDLLHDAADRITGDLERRVRAKLVALDDAPVGAEGVTDAAAVIAEADRILVGAALASLDDRAREALSRALTGGEPRFALARDLGLPEAALEALLRDSLLALWPGERPGDGHASLEGLASRALGIRIVDGGHEHIAGCRDCRDAWRSLNDLVGAVTRLSGETTVLPPRAGLWDSVREAVDAGAPAPEPDWRAEAAEQAARAQRRRTMVMGVAIVASSLLVAVGIALSQMFLTGDRTAVASGSLEDPRNAGAQVGEAWVETTPDGLEVVVIDGLYREYPDAYLEAWLVVGDAAPVSLGQVSSAHYEVAVPVATAVGARLEISREPWDGDATQTGDVIAEGVLR